MISNNLCCKLTSLSPLNSTGPNPRVSAEVRVYKLLVATGAKLISSAMPARQGNMG